MTLDNLEPDAEHQHRMEQAKNGNPDDYTYDFIIRMQEATAQIPRRELWVAFDHLMEHAASDIVGQDARDLLVFSTNGISFDIGRMDQFNVKEHEAAYIVILHALKAGNDHEQEFPRYLIDRGLRDTPWLEGRVTFV